MNIKVVLEYDGSGFAGWQQQASGRTVEAELKRALRSITGKAITVYGAGRTDAGAHAEGQVVNFHTDGRIAPRRMMAALWAAGGHPNYTEYPGVGHKSWDRAYGTDYLYEWLLKHKRK